MTTNRSYMTVLKDLERDREGLCVKIAELQKQITEVDQLIFGLKRRVALGNEPNSFAVPEAGQNDGTPIAHSPRVKGMSMRWAILRLLGNHEGPMSVGEVADTLREGGFPNPEKIRGNAAAVLSRLVALQEAENAGNKYTVTDKGREVLSNMRLPETLGPGPTETERSESTEDV